MKELRKNNANEWNKNELILKERLELTMSVCDRYKMSFAYSYFRITYPISLQQNKHQLEPLLQKQIIYRLKRSVKEIDTVVQIDETDYIILLMDITEEQSRTALERICRTVTDTYRIDFHHINLICHIGSCMFPYGANNSEQLRFIAKAEMFEAKKVGDNQISIFQDQVNADIYRMLKIENDLTYALRNGQMYVQYQPQISLKDMKIIGMEALIRWNHPSFGEIPPVEFIDLAEKAGLMTDLFFRVFEEVCKTLVQEQLDTLKFSINLSVNDLLYKNLIERLSLILEKYQVHPSLITLEIVEHIEIYAKDQVKIIINQLKDLGFTIALDDFGNGYFSFSDFLQLPIDYVKLDKNFVASLIKNNDHKKLISSIITMIQQLNLPVIVEGIEDDRQFMDWKNLGVDIIQGYYISKPIHGNEINRTVSIIENKLGRINKGDE